MTPEQREQVVQRLRKAQDDIRTSKGKSYAGTEDALANFKEVAARSGQSKYQVWLVYFLKHVMAIENAIKENAALPVESSEGLAGRINDVMIYAELLACLAQEDGLLDDLLAAPEQRSLPFAAEFADVPGEVVRWTEPADC